MNYVESAQPLKGLCVDGLYLRIKLRDKVRPGTRNRFVADLHAEGIQPMQSICLAGMPKYSLLMLAAFDTARNLSSRLTLS
eukprot:2381449-Pleurochrysis_carterae.AAC.1